MNKFNKFFQTWIWFVTNYILKNSMGFCTVIILGIISRVGLLLGFLVTVKCVIWTTDPQSLPSRIYSLRNSYELFVDLSLIVAPCLVFLGAGVCKHLHNKLIIQLESDVAKRLCIDIYTSYKSSKSDGMSSRFANGIAASLKDCNQTATMIVMRFTNILIMLFVIIIASAVSLIINWAVMLIMSAFSLVLAFIYIYIQHKRSTARQDFFKQLKIREINAHKGIKSFDNASNMRPSTENDSIGILKDIITDLRVSKVHARVDENDSNLTIDIGQAVLIGVFLLSIQQFLEKTSDLVWVAVLAIVIRFILSYAQSITRDLGKLITHHQTLVRIRNQVLS